MRSLKFALLVYLLMVVLQAHVATGSQDRSCGVIYFFRAYDRCEHWQWGVLFVGTERYFDMGGNFCCEWNVV